MGIVLWIVFGAIVGVVASMLTGSKENIVVDIIVGIVGAVLGGWLMSFFGKSGVTGFNFYSFFVALLGAIILIAIVRAFR